jgi:hypothetical protein
MNVEIGTETAQFLSGNICLRLYSVGKKIIVESFPEFCTSSRGTLSNGKTDSGPKRLLGISSMLSVKVTDCEFCSGKFRICQLCWEIAWI